MSLLVMKVINRAETVSCTYWAMQEDMKEATQSVFSETNI